MKIILILKDGTRFADRDVDDAAVRRGYIEFNDPTKLPIQLKVSPSDGIPRYSVCLHDGNENGVPVFRERGDHDGAWHRRIL